jgi:hypothetical protein
MDPEPLKIELQKEGRERRGKSQEMRKQVDRWGDNAGAAQSKIYQGDEQDIEE